MQLRSKLFVVALGALGLFASSASAATVTYTLDLTVDNVWKVFADVSDDDNFGLASYSFQFAGQTLTHDNAGPRSTSAGASGDPSGFTLLRSADNTNAAAENNVTISASQDTVGIVPNPNLVYGFGQEASNFAAEGIAPGGTVEGNPWAEPLLLAQGTYTRIGSTLDFNRTSALTFVNVFSAADIPTDEINPPVSQIPNANESFVIRPFVDGPGGNTPPTVVDAEVNNYNANLPNAPTDPKVLTHQFVATDTDVPAQTITWDALTLLSYTPNYGGTGAQFPPGPQDNQTPLFDATLSPTGLFSWTSEGSRRGDYVWQVRATDNGTNPNNLSDLGTITVHVTGVPEPSTLALFGLALVGGIGLVRRRNG